MPRPEQEPPVVNLMARPLKESVLTLEKREWEPKFGLIVISGKPGAGTSTLAKGLSLGTGASLYKAGDAIRELSATKERVTGFIERDEAVDELVDSKVREMTLRAKVSTPAIAEAQIGAATVLQTQKDAESRNLHIESPIIRVLIWAKKEVRDKRLQTAARERGEFRSLRKISNMTSEREKGDLEYWRNLYSWIGDDDPLEKGARDAEGNPIYDIEIDNSDQGDPKETLDELVTRLRRIGLLRPVQERGRWDFLRRK